MIELIQKYADATSAVKLAQSIERLVREGRFAAGSILPPVRELAEALGVSPGTAAAAYKALRDRGVVSGDRRRGTRVLGEQSSREYRDVPPAADELDLRVANPDPALLVHLEPLFKKLKAPPGGYGGDHLEPKLLAASRHWFEKDSIDASHVFVAGGAIGVLQRALRAVCAAGDKVAVEDPGFNEHHAVVTSVGCTPVPVAIDDEGPLPDALLAALRSGARAIMTTARCQSPTGAAITPARAAALSAVLRESPETAVLLDDYGALLCKTPFAAALSAKRFCVVRSFNKAIAPDMRVAVAVGDELTIFRMREQQWLGDGWISPYLQRICADAMEQRAVLKRAAEVYAVRREALRDALSAHDIEAHGVTGLNVWIPVQDEATVVAGLAAHGWHVRAGARYRLKSAPAVRITTARLETSDALRVARAFADIVQQKRRRAP